MTTKTIAQPAFIEAVEQLTEQARALKEQTGSHLTEPTRAVSRADSNVAVLAALAHASLTALAQAITEIDELRGRLRLLEERAHTHRADGRLP